VEVVGVRAVIDGLQQYIGGARQIEKSTGEMGRGFDDAASKSGKLGKSMGTALKVGALGVAAGLGVAGVAVVSFAKKAAAEQVGIERLQTAIKALDKAHVGSAAAVEKVVAQREKLSFSDDQLRQSLALLVASTSDYEEAVRRQGIAMDVTRGTGIDLETTSRLLGKVTEESVNVFTRYGIKLDKNATETEALAAVQAKFAGQSEAYANTAAGKWERFGNQMENIKETIGGALLPTVTKLGGALNDFITAHQADIDAFAAALGKKIPEAIDAIGSALARAGGPLTLFFNNAKEGFETIKPGLEWILDHKVALAGAFVAIGAAALVAFTPVTGPIAAIVATLTALLFTIGLVKDKWKELTEANAEAKRTNEEQSKGLILLEATLRGLGTFLDMSFRGTLEMARLAAGLLVEALYKLGEITFNFLAFHADNLREKFWQLRDAGVEVWGAIKVQIDDFLWLLRGVAADSVVIFDGLKDDFWKLLEPIQWVIDKINDLIGAYGRLGDVPSPGDVLGGIFGKIGKLIPGRAAGGLASGITLVGERGPEIVNLPPASRVYSNAESRAMVGRIDLGELPGVMDRGASGVLDVARRIFGAVLDFIRGLPFASTVADLMAQVVDGFRRGFETVDNLTGDILSETFATVRTIASDILAAVLGIPATISTAAGSFFSAALDLGEAIFGGLMTGLRQTPGMIGAFLTGIKEAVKTAINAAIDAINDAIPDSIPLKIRGIGIDVPIPDNPLPHVALAKGTASFAGGLALLGEHGREFAFLPRGTAVAPANQTNAILRAVASLIPGSSRSAGSTIGISMPISVNVQEFDWSEVRRAIHREVDSSFTASRSRSTRAGAAIGSGIG
jgi:phage-related protein